MALAVLAAAALAACDQGLRVAAESAEGRPTPAVAFKTPRTTPTQPSPTPAQAAATAPTATAAPTGALTAQPTPAQPTAARTTAAAGPATAIPTAAATVATAAPTVQRTLAPPSSTASPAAEGALSAELRAWVSATLGNRQAGAIAVRPYEFDAELEVLSETNNVAQVLEDELLGRAFSTKMTSFYFVQADRNFNTGDAFVLRRPVLMGEMVTVHSSESDAASFLTDFRDFAVNSMGSLSQSYLRGQFPAAQPRVQQDTGFGIAAEEFTVVADFDLGGAEAPGRPQLYIMVARQGNVNLALMVLYLDSQPRLRPFGLMDRLVGKVT